MSDHVTLGGRYRLGTRLGIGGTAEVRLALDTRLNRPVAVKLLRPELVDDLVASAMFSEEARAAASLSHPTIVAVYDSGVDEDAVTGAPVPYLVLELVLGETVRSLLRGGRPLPPRRALRVALGVLTALEHSHAAGVVHSDITPANVLVTAGGDVKVTDFGIARRVSESAGAPPGTAIRGTAKYLAPERLSGGAPDARSDVYATGCLLHELLVGRPPFAGDSREVIRQHLEVPPPPPSVGNPALDHAVDPVVLRALAKDPADRYPGAAEMAAAVRAVLFGQLRTAPRPVLLPPLPAARRVVAARAPARRRTLVAAALVAALLPVGGLLLPGVVGPGSAEGEAVLATALGGTVADAGTARTAALSEPREDGRSPAGTAGAALLRLPRTAAGTPAAPSTKRAATSATSRPAATSPRRPEARRSPAAATRAPSSAPAARRTQAPAARPGTREPVAQKPATRKPVARGTVRTRPAMRPAPAPAPSTSAPRPQPQPRPAQPDRSRDEQHRADRPEPRSLQRAEREPGRDDRKRGRDEGKADREDRRSSGHEREKEKGKEKGKDQREEQGAGRGSRSDADDVKPSSPAKPRRR